MATSLAVPALHKVEIFSRNPGLLLGAVAGATTEVRAEPGEVLVEGQVAAQLGAVVEGQFRVHRRDEAALDDLLVDWPELARGVIHALVGRLSAEEHRAGETCE